MVLGTVTHVTVATDRVKIYVPRLVQNHQQQCLEFLPCAKHQGALAQHAVALFGALMVPRPFATTAHKEALGTPGRADGRPALFCGWARPPSGTALASGPGNANRGSGADNGCPTLKLDLNPLVAS